MPRVRSLLLVLLAFPAIASAQSDRAQVFASIYRDVSPPLREIPPGLWRLGQLEAEPVKPIPSPRKPSMQPDPVVQQLAPVLSLAPATSLNFDGLGNGFTGPQGPFAVQYAPPDNNGAVGDTQFVETVNVGLAVFNKTTGAPVYGPVPINTLWTGFAGGCETNNDGDPTVVFDHIAHRWVISQFSVSSRPYLQCVAVSTTADATGSYYRYAFSYGNTAFNDYPKMGVWPDGYYETYNIFNNGATFAGAKICALDRAKMLTGAAATQQCFNTSTTYGGLLPADLDGATLPPAGAPNYVVALGATSSQLAVWKFHVDWTTPANSTFTGPTAVTVASYSEACGGGACIPQSGTSNQLDSLADRIMHRATYRNFGDHESLLVNHSVTAGSSVGVRWYELRTLSGTPTAYQQGTYAPDSNYRWMGSIAMDQSGNTALGYSVSSSALKPEVRYTGRLAGDPLGTMTQGEGTIVAGGGSQTGTLRRWGDYTSMSVDPVDDCTFWYTNQYIPANGTFNWRTRIAAFKFAGCGTGPDFSLAATPATQTVTQGNSAAYTLTETPLNGFSGDVTLNVTGLPAGATATLTPNPTASTSTLTVQTTGATPAGTSTLTITGTSGSLTHTTTVQLTVQVPDFSLSATPASRSVVQGNGTTYSVTETPSGGFAGAVSLAVSGLPAGASGSFGPNPTTGSSTLTVSTLASTPAGTYTLTITGASGALTHTTTVQLVVTAGVPFSLSATTTSQTISGGQSTTYAITITRSSGFTGAVSFSVSGLPSRVTGTFNLSSTTGNTSTLTITTKVSARRGTYPLTITGVSGSSQATVPVTLTIQ